MPHMQVEKNHDPSYILRYLLELIVEIWQILIFFLFEIWRIRTIFFIKNPLNWSKSLFFHVQVLVWYQVYCMLTWSLFFSLFPMRSHQVPMRFPKFVP
jgi:hypothetical protein